MPMYPTMENGLIDKKSEYSSLENHFHNASVLSNMYPKMQEPGQSNEKEGEYRDLASEWCGLHGGITGIRDFMAALGNNRDKAGKYMEFSAKWVKDRGPLEGLAEFLDDK